MSPYKKNVAVGVTVLVALGLLAWMILRFSDAPFRLFAKEQMTIYFKTVSAEGLGDGSPVYYMGVSVGRVKAIQRSEDPANVHVLIESVIETEPPVPANVEGVIRSQLFGGASAISLVRVRPSTPGAAAPATRPFVEPEEVLEQMADQKDIPPVGKLQAGAVIEANFVGIDLFPRQQFHDLAVSLTKTSDEFRMTARQVRENELVPKLTATIEALRQQVARAGNAIEAIDKLVGDEKVQGDVRQALANFRETSESAKNMGHELERLTKKAEGRFDETADNANKLLTSANAKLDKVGKQISERLEQVASILQQIESASRKLNEGQGTAAMLLNDPKMYENLLDVSKELKLSVLGFKRLLEQWEQEGVPFKLK